MLDIIILLTLIVLSDLPNIKFKFRIFFSLLSMVMVSNTDIFNWNSDTEHKVHQDIYIFRN